MPKGKYDYIREDKIVADKKAQDVKEKNNKVKEIEEFEDSYNEKRMEAARKALSDDSPSRVDEVIIFIYLAIALFLLCSNFGWCGVFGNFFSHLLFGLFGTISYIIPIYAFFTAALIMSNGAQKKLVKRVFCVGLFLVAAAFIFQAMDGVSGVTIKNLYVEGKNKEISGGVLLGGMYVIISSLLGNIGAFIIIALLVAIGIIVVLDISLLDIFKKKYKKGRDKHIENKQIRKEQMAMKAAENPNKDKDMLRSNEVLPDTNLAKEEKKPNAEEVHELKPGPAPNEKIILGADNNATPIGYFNITSDKGVRDINPYQDGQYSQNQNIQTNNTHRMYENQSVNNGYANVQPTYNNVTDSNTSAQNVIPLQPFYEGTHREEISNNSYADVNISVAADDYDTVERSYSNTSQKQDVFVEHETTPVVKADTKHTNTGRQNNQSKQESSDENVAATIDKATNTVIKKYKFPPVSLLKRSGRQGRGNGDAQVRETAAKLKTTLENFGVNVTITNYSCGPSVTRYELQPEQGVKVSKILGLADDIKLNLAAADIRIEAPIPGKAAIGIEVPNKESSPVFFGDLLESEDFKKYPSNIAFAVGKDISGQVIVADIAKMPHLLVAGATGSGKSVCINTLIMSLLYKASPEDVKLIMVDPKQVELSIYNGIPHMLIPVVTDPKKAAGALNWAVTEMTKRYQIFAEYNVRNLQGYNEKVLNITGNERGNDELKKLPQIIIIVDELADLMMVAHGEVEDAIVRLSQLARAAGIHLVIATQRPSVDVITGLIKANVPSRIAMTVSSGVDSRTILDQTGAEKLLGKGDMLFYPTGYPKPVRVQGAFLSDDEIANVVDYIKSQNLGEGYDEQISSEIESAENAHNTQAAAGEPEVDDYFADAGRFIIGKDKASIGMLQRVYKIGFNRAARIMDQLADAGVVGPEEGTKPRKVLMSMEEFESYCDEHL